mmetsp:Transcript_32647/g.101033  ORF Transcript_32647/g.101033 Transcript_32647/m.101033 type:complete len:303 (+) Transcript_32647:259-1167(+)
MPSFRARNKIPSPTGVETAAPGAGPGGVSPRRRGRALAPEAENGAAVGSHSGTGSSPWSTTSMRFNRRSASSSSWRRMSRRLSSARSHCTSSKSALAARPTRRSPRVEIRRLAAASRAASTNVSTKQTPALSHAAFADSTESCCRPRCVFSMGWTTCMYARSILPPRGLDAAAMSSAARASPWPLSPTNTKSNSGYSAWNSRKFCAFFWASGSMSPRSIISPPVFRSPVNSVGMVCRRFAWSRCVNFAYDERSARSEKTCGRADKKTRLPSRAPAWPGENDRQSGASAAPKSNSRKNASTPG